MANQYEINRTDQLVDVRPWGTRIAEKLADPEVLSLMTAATLLVTWTAPIAMLITVPFIVTVFVVSGSAGSLLPMRYPPSAVDPEAKKTGSGIWFMGNMEFAKKKEERLPLESAADKFKEVWSADDDMRKHALILGSTGSGKSELLKGIFFCALCWGSGFFVADGKADNKLPLDVQNMARFFGRDDDILQLNFLMGGKTPKEVRASRLRRTNKMNPVSTADSDTISQMGANLLPKVDGDAKNWQEKALTCWRGLVPALCWKRDNEGMNISVTTFVDYLALTKLEELYVQGYRMAQENDGVWDEAFTGLKSYLEVGLPGFKLERPLRKAGLMPPNRPMPGAKPESPDQESAVYDQHGYRATQLNPALNLLDKTYGHIFQDKFSEIDMVDVTLNNRILMMLIPSLEKSSQEAESLGKLAIACLKVMMGKNLGAEIEGTRERTLESKATEANYPYVIALDELGYYFSDGIAVMFAQARSLGFMMIAAAQDIEKLTEGSRAAEAGAMLANQVMKVFMRIDDANKTNEMIQKYLGKVNVAVRETYEYRDGLGQQRLQDVRVQEIPVATLANLQMLTMGKAVVNSMGKTFKMSAFYVGSFIEKYPLQNFHVNRFLQVRGLTKSEITDGLIVDGVLESLTLPIDVLNDKQLKGVVMQDVLTGRRDMPDLRSTANEAVYSAKYDVSMEMINAVAAAVTLMPANVTGSRRAIVLYQVARNHLKASRNDLVANGGVHVGGDALKDATHRAINIEDAAKPAPERFITPAQAAAASLTSEVGGDVSGELIASGSGTGIGPNSLTSPYEEDPFDFLNDSKSLERKPAAKVMKSVATNAAVASTASLTSAVSVALPMAQALRDGFIDKVSPESVGLTPAADFPLPARLASAFQAIINAGQPLDFTGVLAAVQTPVDKAAADAQWIGRALAGAAAGLASKGDTVVGFTEKTLESFQRVEAALGNPNAAEAAGAIEQLVAQQTTPLPLDPAMSGAEYDDLTALLADVESSTQK